MKQRAWFEEEVKFQEMKRKMSVDLIKEERKMKHQTSQGKKKKKSKSKNGTVEETEKKEGENLILSLLRLGYKEVIIRFIKLGVTEPVAVTVLQFIAMENVSLVLMSEGM